jgi:DNA-binding Xre family transcriptional regulator
MTRSKHRGSNFREFLAEEGLLEEVESLALKQAVALEFAKLLEEQKLSKTEMAARMKTSRAAVDRLLDPEKPSATLATLERAARALGCKLKLEIVPA